LSHAEQRKEKNCLNCGTIVQGHYCQNCGQENIVPHETFWHMVTHFFYDITHFDSNFFNTVKDLLIKPGFLTNEYIQGRRKSYLHPVKMYVFTSAVFFLIFFTLYSFHENDITTNENDNQVMQKLVEGKDKVFEKLKTKEDSLLAFNFYKVISQDSSGEKNNKIDIKDTAKKGLVVLSFDDKVLNYKSVAEYDSIQKTLSRGKKDGWFLRTIYRKTISLNMKYKGEQSKLGALIFNKFMHSFPYILFVSLPLYAFFLYLLYKRHKKIYFVDHGIFLIHLYVFTFILMLVFIGLQQLSDAFDWGWIGFLQAGLIIYGIWYAFKAMKNFYGQGRGKTLGKYLLFNLLCFFSINVLFALFLFVTFFQV